MGADAPAGNKSSTPSTASAITAPALQQPLRPAPGKPGLRLDTTVKPRKDGKPIQYQYDGAIVRAARADHPLQMINPKAPEKYGNGSENLSIHPRTGQVEGIKLFSIGK